MTTTHPPLRLKILSFLAFVLAAEVLLISLTFDAQTLKSSATPGFLQFAFSQLGQVAKFLVVATSIYLVIVKSQLAPALRQISQQFSSKRFWIFFGLHLIAYIVLLLACAAVFGSQRTTPPSTLALFGWLFAAILTFAFWLLSAISLKLLKTFLRKEWPALLVTFTISLVAWTLSLASQQGWSQMVDYTFAVTSAFLSFYDAELITSNPATKHLGLGNFIVHIAPVCSGYEGIGLITAFTALYLYLERKTLRFPLAFILFPIGIMLIWLFNALRIAVLVMIGYHWSPSIAVGGFHSQAGWITFILTSLGLLWIAGRSHLFNKQANSQPQSAPTLNLPIACLLPLIALLATTLFDTAIVADFSYFYPLRVIVVAAVIVWLWRSLQWPGYKPAAIVLPAAIVVALLWVWLLGEQPEADQSFKEGLQSLGAWSIPWLIMRILGTTITVPIAEELAFRAYLLCKLSREEVSIKGHLPFSLLAVVLSSLAFGFLHGAWIAGTVAGIIYALVRLHTRHVGDAIAAHALTNLLLAVYAISTGHWSVL